jgi:hypothetical protein
VVSVLPGPAIIALADTRGPTASPMARAAGTG